MECHHPNWRTHSMIFFRGVGGSTTNQIGFINQLIIVEHQIGWGTSTPHNHPWTRCWQRLLNTARIICDTYGGILGILLVSDNYGNDVEWYGFCCFCFCFFSIMGILGLHQGVILLREDREDFHEAEKPNCSFFFDPTNLCHDLYGVFVASNDVLFPLVGCFFCRGLKKPLENTGFFDDRWYTKPAPKYVHQKDISEAYAKTSENHRKAHHKSETGSVDCVTICQEERHPKA